VSSEIATSIPREQRRQRVARRPSRTLAVQLIGPLTVVAGLVWAVAQPYRIVFLDRAGQGLYDYLFQPPLLVVAVGLVFMFVVAPGLVEDLESVESRGSPS
jgi:fructose-specific phosphotransferase system IIC component